MLFMGFNGLGNVLDVNFDPVKILIRLGDG